MISDISQGFVHTTIQNSVATITFSHPSSNSFPSSLLQKLVDELNTIDKNNNVNVVILQSEGKGAFCAGASFDELLSIDNLKDGKKFFSGFANVINAMRNCSKIIIGRIHGKAVGGGVGLASACDYAMATTESSIKLSEIAIGIGPFVIEPAVSRKIGTTAFAEMTLTPTKWQSAIWAKEKGLYAEVFQTQEELDKSITDFASKLAQYSPEALSEIKTVFWQNTSHWSELLYERAAISGRLVLSDFTKNALNQFKK